MTLYFDLVKLADHGGEDGNKRVNTLFYPDSYVFR